MRAVIGALAVCLCLSAASGQYVEATIALPDSVSGLHSLSSLLFHGPRSTIYVGGSGSSLIAVDAQNNMKLRKVAVGSGPHVLCSDPAGNKVYCSNGDSTLTVIDAATNQPVKTVAVEQVATDLVYVQSVDKLYCGNAADSLLRVIDCATDSVTARVPVSVGPGALCYSPQLNRLYCAHSATDEVTAIDCNADTVVDVVWVRGVRPGDICYDSASNCVYTANSGSGTVSVIDCGADTMLRLVAAGRGPAAIIAGPPGKVYCANSDDSTITVISDGGAKSVRTVQEPLVLSYNSMNNKVYCASGYRALVAVIDAAIDSVVTQVGTGYYPVALCCNGNAYAACSDDNDVDVIGGVSDSVEAVIPFGPCNPGPLCYNTTNNRLYCLDPDAGLLFAIDGGTNQVLKALNVSGAGYGSDTLIWSPVSNKVYIMDSDSGTVSVVDCIGDSIVGTVETGEYPCALCCHDNGKVYVAVDSGVDVIDGFGDTMLAVVSIPTSHYYYPSTLCYNRSDGKVYVTAREMDTCAVCVIDTRNDSVVANIPPGPNGYAAAIVWNQRHDKVYACGYDYVDVIDCAGDTVLRRINVQAYLCLAYSDSACDKVYFADGWYSTLRIINAAIDASPQSLPIGYPLALLDNCKRGPANRLYCAIDDGTVAVVIGYKTDSVLKLIPVGNGPAALAWNPTHSRMYVSNSGSSSISVIRDTLSPGIEEATNNERGMMRAGPTVVRGVLNLQPAIYNLQSEIVLLAADGRKVMDLHPGANDVRALVPGVYFVREAQAQAQAQAVRKIVLTK
jgi:YVTN family beta-propeller protein